MRNPQGYATIVGDLDYGAPTVVEGKDGSDFRHTENEIDTFTCGHCCRIIHVVPRSDAANIGGLCKQCMSLICPRCVGKQTCMPWEKKMLRREARERFRQEAGLNDY